MVDASGASNAASQQERWRFKETGEIGEFAGGGDVDLKRERSEQHGQRGGATKETGEIREFAGGDDVDLKRERSEQRGQLGGATSKSVEVERFDGGGGNVTKAKWALRPARKSGERATKENGDVERVAGACDVDDIEVSNTASEIERRKGKDLLAVARATLTEVKWATRLARTSDDRAPCSGEVEKGGDGRHVDESEASVAVGEVERRRDWRAGKTWGWWWETCVKRSSDHAIDEARQGHVLRCT
jgi:hypothetical protein